MSTPGSENVQLKFKNNALTNLKVSITSENWVFKEPSIGTPLYTTITPNPNFTTQAFISINMSNSGDEVGDFDILLIYWFYKSLSFEFIFFNLLILFYKNTSWNNFV